MEDKVGIVIFSDSGQLHIGKKRNTLIEKSTAEYVCFLDDDDTVTTDYIPEILKAIESKPDVVTFNGWMTTNGANRVDWEIRLGESYEERNGKYYRFPNHLCVFKKSLVEHVKFPDIWKGEDYVWAKKIRDLGLLKTEVHIDKQLYHYDYRTHK